MKNNYSGESYQSIMTHVQRCPGVVAVLPDSHLLKLVNPLPVDTAPIVIGELLVRHWLYQKHAQCSKRSLGQLSIKSRWAKHATCCLSKRFAEYYQALLLPLRTTSAPSELLSKSFRLSSEQFNDESEREVWSHATTRISAFLRCDGIIPVTSGDADIAVPIPFKFTGLALLPCQVVDQSRRPVVAWQKYLPELSRLIGADCSMSLLCEVGGYSELLRGNSFMLPVFIANARRTGLLPDFHPMQVLATGQMDECEARRAGGMAAKLRLAVEMGMHFVAVGQKPSENVISLPSGASIEQMLKFLNRVFEQRGIGRLTLVQAKARLSDLNTEIAHGSVKLDEAARRLVRYENVFSSNQKARLAREGYAESLLVRSAIANHSGNPEAATALLNKTARLSIVRANPLLLVQSVAQQVVSLTDRGHFDQAAQVGRGLLSHVRNRKTFLVSEDDRVLFEMVACGVLGGQPLMQKALYDQDYQAESLNLLRKARSLAEHQLAQKYDPAKHICRDAVYIALWYALFKPERTLKKYRETLRIFDRFPVYDSSVSRAYLNRVLHFGVYRLWLLQRVTADTHVPLPMPDEKIGHLSWIYATSLKYRGTMHAVAGRYDAAKVDLCNSLAMLDMEDLPLLRFIGATVALQAGECLRDTNRRASDIFLKKALKTFKYFHRKNWFHGPITTKEWVTRTEGILKAVPEARLPHPQKYFFY